MVAYSLEFAGRLAATCADHPSCLQRQHTLEHAVRLYAAAQGVRSAIGAPLDSAASARSNDEVASLRDAVGRAAFDVTWGEGVSMTYDQAISYALEFLDGLQVVDTNAKAIDQSQPKAGLLSKARS